MLDGFHAGLDFGLDRRGPVSWDLKQRHGAVRRGGTIHDWSREPPDSTIDELPA